MNMDIYNQAGIITFAVTIYFAVICGDKYAVDDKSVFGGKQDIVPGTIGIFSGFGWLLINGAPRQASAPTPTIIGAICAAFLIGIFRWVRK
jgi:hypothetical protein